MALKKVMDSRSMQRKQSVGVDPTGKELFESQTVSKINKQITDEDFCKFDELISNLSAHKERYLYEKVSNKFTSF